MQDKTTRVGATSAARKVLVFYFYIFSPFRFPFVTNSGGGGKLLFYILVFPAHSSLRAGLLSISLLYPVDAGRPRAGSSPGKKVLGPNSKGELTTRRVRKQGRHRRKQDDRWPQVPSKRRITTHLHSILPRISRTYEKCSGPGPLPDRRFPVIFTGFRSFSRALRGR
jgi:hypothetical protein